MINVPVAVILLAITATTLLCHQPPKKNPPSPPITISTSIDTLRQFLTLPESASVAWLVRPRGVQNSRMAPGPTDYELFALLQNPGADWLEKLKREHAGEEQSLDTAIARALGLLHKHRGRINGDKVYFTGNPLDVDSLVRRPFSWGSGLIIDSAVLFRAVTF